ncbi:MAG: hypothetical protein KGR98_02895 [Verrucomicrobia bacterium]|nr:hypothetical protein [Verrucomicrobiota bacterium]MDE3099548.1 hypothetical protein [Verrucomicrobiota bacterium]
MRFQQRMMDNIRQSLGFTNDTDWAAVQPLVQKVLDAHRAMGTPGRMMFRGRRGGRAGQFGPSDPAGDALQSAIDSNAPADQIKGLLARYKDSQKAKQGALDTAEANLRQVLTVKQEAEATLMGLLQ